MATTDYPFGGGTPSAPYTQQRRQAPVGYVPQAHAQGYQAQSYQAQSYQPQGYPPQPSPSQGQGAAAQAVPQSRGVSAAGMTQIMGALLSVALVAGVGVWGYKLIMRDVSGVPIVQATEGPMRVAPENPGGRQADHQGLAVNEVAGRGAAAGPADQLVLAPTPVDLSEEDAPNDALRLTPVAPSQQAQAQAPAAPQAPATLTPQDAAIQALADQIAAGVAPLTQSEAEVETPPVVTSVAAPSLADIAPEARSPRPVARPQNLRTASVAPNADTTPAAGLDIDPATLPAGTRLVQLGAYDSADVAQTEWARIAGRFDSFFDGKRRVIERAQSGGRTFYRLRAEGFGDLADARRFCAALVAERADCIPVVTR